MGNSLISSTETIEKRKRQEHYKFIQELGERLPFGNDELDDLLYYHHAFYTTSAVTTEDGSSFLSSGLSRIVSCVKSKYPVEELERKIEMIEKDILPKSIFGSKLEKLLSSSSSTSTMSSNIHNNNNNNTTYNDINEIIKTYQTDSSKMFSLEQFCQTLAECCGRRGGRYSLKTLFQIVSSSSSSSSSGNAEITQLVDLLYRIAVATSYLSSSSSFSMSLDTASTTNLQKPKALIQSLLKSSKSQNSSSTGMFSYQSPSYSSSPYDNSNNASSSCDEGYVTQDTFFSWVEDTAPMLSCILPTFFHYILFPTKLFPPSRSAFTFPYYYLDPSNNNKTNKDGSSKAVSSFILDCESGDGEFNTSLFSFASMSPSLGGMWYPLFLSDKDGLSFNRLLNSILGYSGPTLTIIQATSGEIFGAFTNTRWKEDKKFYGDSDCFLYQLNPKVSVYRPRGGSSGSTNYMYCNPEARSKGYDGLPHGIGFGGNLERPRLFISEKLDSCVALANGLTFQYGELISPTPENSLSQKTKGHFEVDRLEVWGVGGESTIKEALESRQGHRAIVDANIKKARKVDKAQFLDDFKSGLIESKAFQHREQMRGRDGGCCLDDADEE